MILLKIGENAGRIWEVLDQTTEITFAQLKNRLNMEENALYAAIGWLAREGKIFCCQKHGDLYLSNKCVPGFYHFG